MDSTKDLRRQILNPDLSIDERAQLRCQLAKQLQEDRDYEAAREAMGELWFGVGKLPNLEGLNQPTSAEVLLRTGALTGWISRLAAAQVEAKNMLNESIRIFKSLRDARKVAEAEIEIAYCYVREDAIDDARVMLAKARARLDDRDGDFKAITILRSVSLEKLENRWDEALSILMQAAPLFEASDNHALKGKFHYDLADVFIELSAREKHADYLEQALREYSAASFHFAQTGQAREQAAVEIKLAKTLLKANRLKEAHDHLDLAQSLLTSPEDNAQIGQVKDARARVLMAEGDFEQAQKMASAAVQILEKEYEQSLRAKAPTIGGNSLSSLNEEEQIRAIWEHTLDATEQGYMEIPPSPEFEELVDELSEEDVRKFLQISDDLVKTRGTAEFDRSVRRAQRFLMMHGFGSADWTTSSSEETLPRSEASDTSMCESADEQISRAAHFLGLRPHQLRYMLKKHHPDLRDLITAPTQNEGRQIEAIKILHVDNDPAVTAMTQEIVQREGWEVHWYREGDVALEELIDNEDEYDLLLLGDELPGLNGLELVECVRDMFHLRHIPIVMLSGTVDEATAREAGADAFLRKPEDIGLLVETITRVFDMY